MKHLFAKLVACAVTSAPATAADTTPVVLQPLPDGGYQPSLATTADGTVHLVYHTGDPAGADIHHTTFDPASGPFSPPVRVNSTPAAAVPAGTVRGARLAAGRNGSLHVAWMGSSQVTPDGDHARTPMLYSRSLDGGRSFSPQRDLITTHGGLDGGGTVAASADGHIHVVWHAAGSDPGPLHRQVVVASSNDDGATFAPEHPLPLPNPLGACPCCGIEATVPPHSSTLLTLFRDAASPGQRDARLVATTPGHTARTLIHDPWPTETCPMSTAGFAASPDTLATAWESEGKIRLATLDPQSLKPRHTTTLATSGGRPQKHPSLAFAPDGSLVVAWTAAGGWAKPGHLVYQHVDATTHRQHPVVPTGHQLPVWSRPAVTHHGDTFVIFF